MSKHEIDEQMITAYLLGTLSEKETEHLDQLGVANDEFAAQLQDRENDLLDAYVRGELTGSTAATFRSHYLATPERRDKVAFAKTLQERLDRSPISQFSQKKAEKPRSTQGLLSLFKVPRLSLQWGFAAASLLMLIAGAYLITENLQLRNQIAQTQTERITLQKREQELRRQLAQQRFSDEEKEKELARIRKRIYELEQQSTGTAQDDVKLIAYNLAPQMRGIGQIPVLSVPAGTDFLALTLELEPNDFSTFQVQLTDNAQREVIWQSRLLKADTGGNSVKIELPAHLLRQQAYLLELAGISSGGVAETLSSYPFRVLIK